MTEHPALLGELQLIEATYFEENRFIKQEIIEKDDLLISVIDSYRMLHNLENDDKGSKQAHNTLVTGQYSPNILPVLATIHEHARETDNYEIYKTCTQTLQNLSDALEIFYTYAQEKDYSPRVALSLIRADSVQGEDTYHNFRKAMRKARNTAVDFIASHYEILPEQTQLVFPNKEQKTFQEQAQQIIQEHKEATQGIDLGREFHDRLHNSNTQIVVLSLDINSTLNFGESHASPENISAAMDEIKGLVTNFKEIYPEKKILVTINTGRPALYAWGVCEMLPPLPEMREIGFAESGGAVFTIDKTQQKVSVAGENPTMWKSYLNDLQSHLLNNISHAENVSIEPKTSMISMQVADTEEEGGTYLYEATNGAPITKEWVEKQTSDWLSQRKASLQIKQEERDFLSKMAEKISITFNPTAGYVDLYNKNLNKFSTPLQTFRSMGYETDNILTVHIGDASTDIPQTNAIDQGEYNEGVDKIFVVAVANSSQKMKTAVKERGKYGKETAREAVLGVGDLARGINRSLNKRWEY